MEKRNKKDFTTICIKKEDVKKLNDYKSYGSEPLWIIIKKFLKGELKTDSKVDASN